MIVRGVLTALTLLAAGCAAEVVRHAAVLSSAVPAQVRQYQVAQSVLVYFDSGYERMLPAGTTLAEIGTLPQGKVLKPINTVFTIEGRHIHEAYPVVDGSRIVGFYLPVENAFAPLSNSVNVLIQEREKQQ